MSKGRHSSFDTGQIARIRSEVAMRVYICEVPRFQDRPKVMPSDNMELKMIKDVGDGGRCENRDADTGYVDFNLGWLY